MRELLFLIYQEKRMQNKESQSGDDAIGLQVFIAFHKYRYLALRET